jgi:hypothetical protein
MQDEEKQYELVCKERFDHNDVKLDKILLLLQGDGDIGLCEQTRNQDKRINIIEAEHANIRQTVRRYFRWVGGIVIGWWLLEKSPAIFEWLRNHL